MARANHRDLTPDERESLAEIAHYWIATYHLQHERLLAGLGHEWAGPPQPTMSWVSDALLYVSAIAVLTQIADKVRDKEVNRALENLWSASPDLRSIRNWVMHPEDYAVGDGNQQQHDPGAHYGFHIVAGNGALVVEAGQWSVALWQINGPAGDLANALVGCLLPGQPVSVRARRRVPPTPDDLRRHLAFEVCWLIDAAHAFKNEDLVCRQDSAMLHARNLLEFTKPVRRPNWDWWIGDLGAEPPRHTAEYAQWVALINSKLTHMGPGRPGESSWPVREDELRLLRLAGFVLDRIEAALAGSPSSEAIEVVREITQLARGYLEHGDSAHRGPLESLIATAP